MSLRDRLASGIYIAADLSPLDLAPREVIVARLAAIIATGSVARLALRPSGNRWRRDDGDPARFADALVGTLPADYRDERDLPVLRARLAPDESFRLFLGRDRALVLMDHRLGDGSLALTLVASVVGDHTPPTNLRHGRDRPVSAALRTTFLEHPSRARELLRVKAAEKASPAPTTTVAVPPERRLGLVTGQISSERRRELLTWMRRRGSLAVTELHACAAALASAGIPVARTGSVLVDLRRYLPAGTSTASSFVTGQPISRDAGIEGGSAQLAAHLRLGRPLAGAAIGSMRSMLRGRAPQRVSPEAQLTVSDMGICRPLERLPWRDRGSSTVSVSVDPAGANGITLFSLIVQDKIMLSLSFDPGFFDRTAVQQACDALCGDPVGVLESKIATLA